eukprot:scaffold2189_cov116-Cylindrotheca_fusiformis.AAC.2
MIANILKLIISSILLSTGSSFSPSLTSTLTRSEATHTGDSRRVFLGSLIASGAALTVGSLPSVAAEADTLDSYLYRVLRVREATQQERRLIKSGKFKDMQRANVKLAVKFMIQNYSLGDAVVGASAYLKGGNQMKAIDVGQTAVQNLQTILEYFDTKDVENIKVGANSMAGKEELVLGGLQSAQSNIDQFLGYFPDETLSKRREFELEAGHSSSLSGIPGTSSSYESKS